MGYEIKADTHDYDSPERIQRCLHCTRKRCTNCYVTEKRREQTSRIRTEKTTAIREAFFAAYLEAHTDKEAGALMGKSQATAHRYRSELLLPPPGSCSKEEKQRLIEEWKRRQK